MGRRRHSDRVFVEDCSCLDVSDLRRLGMFSEANTKGPLVLDRLAVGLRDWALLCSVKHENQEKIWVELWWEVVGHDGKAWEIPLDSIQVERLKNPLSGVHYFLKCPMSACSRRVRKLFLPPSRQAFMCRRCHNLRYRSNNKNYSTLEGDALRETKLARRLRLEVEAMIQRDGGLSSRTVGK